MKWTEWRGSFDGRPALLIRRFVTLFGCAAQIHCFVRADDVGCYHTHPAWAIRIILKGGYVEELGDGTKVAWKPMRVGLVRPNLEHRIDSLLDGPSWSLWLRGPKVQKIKLRGYPPLPHGGE